MRDLNSSTASFSVIEPGMDERQMALYRAVHDAGDMTVRTDVLYRAIRKADVEKGLAAIKGAEKRRQCCASSASNSRSTAASRAAPDAGPIRSCPANSPTRITAASCCCRPAARTSMWRCKLIAEAGLQTQTHAVGDETIDVVVRITSGSIAERPIRDLRWTIMHLFHPARRRAQEDERAGVMATMQDHPCAPWPQPAPLVGDEHAAYAIPIRKTIDAGVLVGGGTDGPVVPVRSLPVDVVDDDAPGGTATRSAPSNAITAGGADALHHQQCAHHGRGKGARLDRAGQLADIAVLSQDILSCRRSIRETKLMTVVGGKMVYRNGNLRREQKKQRQQRHTKNGEGRPRRYRTDRNAELLELITANAGRRRQALTASR